MHGLAQRQPLCSSRVAAASLAAPRRVAAAPSRRRVAVRAELDEDTLTLVGFAVAGLGAGLGLPFMFTQLEKRDKDRIEEIRELNRATLKATGETLSEDELRTMRPTRYLDRREFKDDD